MNTILSGKVIWAYSREVLERNSSKDIGFHFTGIAPFHTHTGEITLTNTTIIILGEEEINISLNDLESVYLGFDEVYTRNLVKNFGLFWQPLRLDLQSSEKIYLIIDLTMFSSKTQLWFDTIKEILS